MAVKEHIAYVPYARLVAAFRQDREWTCAACGGRVSFGGFGHAPRPRVPLFECQACGRRSDGCQTFEGHHLLYRGCALEGRASSRCGYWFGDWRRAQGVCPVCGGARLPAPEMQAARGR